MERRAFLKTTLSGTGLLVLANPLAARTYAANDKVALAHVGVGGRGWVLLNTFVKLGRPVALCDVNDKKATRAYRMLPEVAKFRDFRKMLDQKAREIDGVVVATPDHIHAVASAAAIRAGKHVYVEKPMTRTVHESRVLRELAAKHQVATSMGNQGTAAGPFRRALEVIRGGTLGTIEAVHTWNDQGGRGYTEPPKGEAKTPFYLDWNLWLGPAAFRPFHPRWMAWHAWRDFGTGNLGNWASHSQNLAFMALRVHDLWHADPTSRPRIRVEADARSRNRLSFPRWEYVRWHIPARGNLPPITFHWHNGGSRPGIRDDLKKILGHEVAWGPDDWSEWAGCLIVGTEGRIHATAHNATFKLLPPEKFKGVQTSAPEKVARSRGHERDWLEACRGGEKPWANFDYAGPLTEFNMLGNVATQFEGVLEFDPLECKIVNNPEADKALHETYREGWSL